MAALLAIPTLAVDADAQPEGPLLSEQGKAYQSLTAEEGLETAMRYPAEFDPASLVDPEEPIDRPDPDDPDRERLLQTAFFGAIALLALMALIVFGGRRIVGLRAVSNRSRDIGGSEAEAEPTQLADVLETARSMADRRAALVLLVRAALERAGAAVQLPLRRSETAREILRRIPGNWHHRAALGRLVAVEEGVQFGGRPLPEAVFAECLDHAAPILAEPLR